MEEKDEKVFKNPNDVRFQQLLHICIRYFGQPRVKGSHYIFQKPWPGDPVINIQNKNGMAKPYQIKEVLKAIKKLEGIETDDQ